MEAYLPGMPRCAKRRKREIRLNVSVSCVKPQGGSGGSVNIPDRSYKLYYDVTKETIGSRRFFNVLYQCRTICRDISQKNEGPGLINAQPECAGDPWRNWGDCDR